MQPFVLNNHGRLVFPSNFIPELDFSVIESEAQLDSAIRRDFEQKAPKGTQIARDIADGKYASRYELMRDVALNMFWVNRFIMTMYQQQPMRWRDVPKTREDIFLPIVAPWIDKDEKVAAVRNAYRDLPASWDAEVEDRIWADLIDAFGHRTFDATKLPSVKPTIAEALAAPDQITLTLDDFNPDQPQFSYEEILNVSESVPELEALRRWSMVLHNQYPWEQDKVRLKAVTDLTDEDVVVLLMPRDREVLRFVNALKAGKQPRHQSVRSRTPDAVQPIRPYPAVNVKQKFTVQPRIEAIATVKGEYICRNDDLIRNSAYSWSPMSAAEISQKTGIEERRYSARGLDELALDAAEAALEKAGRKPEEIGAVLFCSCTSHRMMPSMATWLSGQLGMFQTHASVDLIAACAGLPYGISEAVRQLQEVNRPVLLVCGEKFSDKIGTVRPSRMIFGDGAAGIVIGPAPEGEEGDISLLQTYGSGPVSQVNSIIWPNPAFDNNLTLFGPEVKALAGPVSLADDRGAAGHRQPVRRRRRHRLGHGRVGGAAPGEQDDDHPARGGGRAGRRQAVLQHRDDGQHVVGEHPDRHRGRGGRGRHRQADVDLRARLRRRRGRRLLADAGGSGGRGVDRGDGDRRRGDSRVGGR